MTDKSDWEGRSGSKWAEHWRRTDRSFAGLTDKLLSLARNGATGRQILDVGCGAGEVALAMARENPRSRVVGIDVSTPLIEAARSRAANHSNVEFVVADAATWTEPGFSPELTISRHGVMFFDDPVAAFRHLRAGAEPGGRLIFSCFRDRSRNTWATRIADLLPAGMVSPSPPGAPGPFAFADPAHVESILDQAGWSRIGMEPVDFAYVAGAGGDPVSDAVSFFMAIGPAAAPAATLEANDRARFAERLENLLENYRDGSIIAFPAAAWIVSARAA